MSVKKESSAYELEAYTNDEVDYFFANDGGPERDEKYGYIGRLRGDFGRNGKEFWSTWMNGYANLKAEAFHSEFNDLIDTLRENGVLGNFNSMSDFCRCHSQAIISDGRGYNYGFKVQTDAHVYFIRLGTMRGDYNFYCYVYERSRLEKQTLLQLSPTKPSLLSKLEENKRKTEPNTKPCKTDGLEV